MSSKFNSPHHPNRAAVDAAVPYRPTTDQEVVDFINHLHAQRASARSGPLAPAHHGAPSAPSPERPTAHHGAPPYTAAHHPNEIAKNEPTCQSGTVSPLQFAAIRYLVAGYRPTFVAKGLNIDRHTLLRWRRAPHFQAHLQQLHQHLAAKTLGPPARRP